MKIIGSAYEHDAIYKYLNIIVKNIGELEKVLQSHLDEDKIVFWMMTNNLTGAIYNNKQIGELCHKYDAYYIMDCTASIGHNELGEDIETYCDCLVNSAHKYNGPKGTGCLWISDRFANRLGITSDSKDNYGLVRGTVDVPSAVAMSWAMKVACENARKNNIKYYKLLSELEKKLNFYKIPHKYVECKNAISYTPAINSIILPEINADALQNFLACQDIYIGVGASACADEKDYRVLKAFGLSEKEAEHTIRISFYEENTEKDILELVEGIVKFKEIFM